MTDSAEESQDETLEAASGNDHTHPLPQEGQAPIVEMKSDHVPDDEVTRPSDVGLGDMVTVQQDVPTVQQGMSRSGVTGSDELRKKKADTITDVGSGISLEGASSLVSGILTDDGNITLRTRINRQLPPDVQSVDQSLQLSRTSMYVDLANKQKGLPKVVKRKLNEQDTVGRYVVQRSLNAGGMGAVLEITDGDFNRQAAMKVMHSRFSNREDSLQRFLEEAQVTAQLEHPNIVPIHDVGVMQDGSFYYTMKLVRGFSLADVIEQLKEGYPQARQHWSEDRILHAFLKVLDGVGYAHGKGVLHRDLKPHNIMIEEHGEVLVVDWGIAKVLGGDDPCNEDSVHTIRSDDSGVFTRFGNVLGTPYYMPPEQAAGDLDAMCPQSDIYSLGATLYELLALHRPLAKEKMKAVIQRVKTGDILPITNFVPDLHLDLLAIIEKSMAFAIDDRYRSCQAMAEDVLNYLAGKAVQARQRNWLERLGSWVRHHKVQVMVTVTMVLLLIAGILGTVVYQHQQDKYDAHNYFTQAQSQLKLMEQAIDNASKVSFLAAAQEKFVLSLERHESPERRSHYEAFLQTQAQILSQYQQEQETLRRQETAREFFNTAVLAQQTADYQQALQAIDAALALDNQTSYRQLQLELRLAQERATREARFLAGQEALESGRQTMALLSQGLENTAPPEAQRLDDDAYSRQYLAHLADIRQQLLKVREQFKQAQTAGLGVPYLQELGAMLSVLQTYEQQCHTMRNNYTKAQELVVQAQGLTDNWPLVEQLCSQALGLFPQLTSAQALRDEALLHIAQQQAQAEAAMLAQQRQQQVRLSRDRATQAWARIQQLDDELAAIDQVIIDKQQQLRHAPIAAKASLFEQVQMRERQQELRLEQVQLALADALQAWQLVQGQTAADTSGIADLLAQLYNWQLEQAQERADSINESSARAQRDYYDSFGMNRFSQQAPSFAVSLSGPYTGTVDVFTEVAGADTLLKPGDRLGVLSGDTGPLLVPSGHYHLRSPHWQRSMTIEDRAIKLYWPVALKQIGSVSCLPVQYNNVSWWMSTMEISHEQYGVFMNAELARAQAFLDAALDRDQLPGADHVYPHFPKQGGGDAWPYWQFGQDEDGVPVQVRRYVVPESIAQQPVTGISRDDAEAYCAWLSTTHTLTVRLPTATEWHWAATAGSDQRRYPWGHYFDPAFTEAMYPGRTGPANIGMNISDRGPFGHQDLAGNVREWLGDRSGELLGSHNAVIAGGAWTYDNSRAFQVQGSHCFEAVPSGALSRIVGFRIVCEEP